MWYAGMFDEVSNQIIGIVSVVLPVGIAVFAFLIALRYSKKTISHFSGVRGDNCNLNAHDEADIYAGTATKEQVEGYYDRNIKSHM